MANATLPEFKLPELKLPKIDLDALFGLQKANLAVLQETQSILLEATQAIARLQKGYVEEVVETLKANVSTKTPAKPDAVLADVQAATQKAVAVAKQGVDLGVAAQQRVVQLVSQRVKANVDELKNSPNPDIKRFLGTETDTKIGTDLGLTNEWAYNIIKGVGNYGEIFERNIGQGSPLKIARGLNALWNKGGIQYAPPVR